MTARKSTILSVILALLLPLWSDAQTETFEINGRTIHVPTPEGFVRVTEDMTAVHRYLAQVQDPLNDTLAYYITKADAEVALAGAFPPLEKTLLLKVNKNLRQKLVSDEGFAEMITAIEDQNQELYDHIQQELQKPLKDSSEGISQEFDINFAIQVSQMVPLGPHFRTDDAISFSLYINYDLSSGEETAQSVVAATSTFLNVSGVVLLQYSYAPKPELEWTREISRNWADATLEANSNSGIQIDWQRTLTHGVIGALCGIGFTLIVTFIKKRKSKTAE